MGDLSDALTFWGEWFDSILWSHVEPGARSEVPKTMRQRKAFT
jgi:hypothetical protein